MPGQISGGPSRTHRLGNQAEIEAAEAALQARSVQGVRRPLPPPAPLAPEVLDDPTAYVGEQIRLGGPQALPAEPPTEGDVEPLFFSGVINVQEISIGVRLTHNRRDYIGEGASITEALSIAASALEEGLAQPVCPHCGQVMPTED